MSYGRKPFKTKDSTLSYFVSQLDNFDPKMHLPLVSTSWSRDIQLRPGITLANESTSFTRSGFSAPGTLSAGNGVNGGNMPWISAETTAIAKIGINGERIVLPLRLLAREISYTSPELERSALLGQPIDGQQMNAMNESYQMNIDQMVYIGSTEVGATGLLNSPLVTAANVPNGIGGTPQWSTKTPLEILADVNTILTQAWLASGYSMVPTELRLPPIQYGYLAATLISNAGNTSILKFLSDNSIAMTNNGRSLNIQPIKWLAARGVGGTDRMLAYTNDVDRVRFPMVPIRRETPYYYGIRFTAPYLWAFGELEVVYPETLRYADGI